MPTESIIKKEVLDIVREDLAVDHPGLDGSSRLIAELGLDSVAFAVAIVAIEERLEVRLPESELIACDTVDDVVAAIESRRDVGASEVRR